MLATFNRFGIVGPQTWAIIDAPEDDGPVG
jgi:hypothetical protein